MLLSTAIPIVMAAIVIVIISRGIPSSPIIPKIKNQGIARLKKLNKKKNKLI